MTHVDPPIHLLGLETSGLTSGVYISRNGQFLGQITLQIKNIHSRRLALMVEQLLAQVGLDYKDLTAIVLSSGPGSFTGLRIGYSLAKGLAHPLHIPMVEVPTLDIWAYQQGKSNLPVLALVDAHRQEIFYAVYRWQENTMSRTTDYLTIPLSRLPEILASKTILTGGDLVHLGESIRKISGGKAVLPYPPLPAPQGWALLELGYQKFIRQEFSPAESCEPLYLRKFKGVT